MPRDYSDKLADAMGAGYDSFTARTYAGGSFALRRLRVSFCSKAIPRPGAWRDPDEEDEEEDEAEEETEEENEDEQEV